MAREVRTYSENEALIRERRDRIMDGSLVVFIEKGYHAATIRDLAKACGMSDATLYRYIGSKDDILHLMCVHRSSSIGELAAFRRDLGDVGPVEALRACFQHHMQAIDSSQDIIMFFNREMWTFSNEDKQIMLARHVKTVEFYKGLLIDGINVGEFQMDSPFGVAHDIFMKIQAWVLRRWLLRQHFTLETYTNTYFDLILKSIRPSTGRLSEKGEEIPHTGSISPETNTAH